MTLHKLPEQEAVIVGEGGEACYCYLALTPLPKGGSVVRTWGLDVLANLPEARFLLNTLVSAASPKSVSSNRQKTSKKLSPEERIRQIAPVKAGQLRLRPTFTSCGVCWGAGKEVPGVRLDWRMRDGLTWQTLPEFPYFSDTRDCRASILDLAEDTEYEMRVADGEATLASGTFRTWKSDVPIAHTVEIDPATAVFPIVISDRGLTNGWIRYTTNGKELVNNTTNSTLIIEGARNIIVEGVVFKGGRGTHVVRIGQSVGVRIRNCEIMAFGRDVYMDFFKQGRGINWPFFDWPGYDTAIRIEKGAQETVVERCYIHDARYPSNSWIYSHPSGPNAIYMRKPDHSTVLRWNDLVGSDENRWNDAVEGMHNFQADGGFNRDADIYGNFMIFCNDDGIELDGGNQNVRCFVNRFESQLTGVSVQGTMVSPTYVYRNLFSGTGEEFGIANPPIKTCGADYAHSGSVVNFFDNTFVCAGAPVDLSQNGQTCRYRAYGNRTSWDSCFRGVDEAHFAQVRDNMANLAIDPHLPFEKLPERPVPYFLSMGRIDGVRMEKDVVTPAMRKVRLICGGEGYRKKFRVRKTALCDWFNVSPSCGTVESGSEIEFTVRFVPEKMAGRHYRRGVFLVRTEDGFSRPCSIYAETDFVPPMHCERPGDIAAYADIPKGISPLATGEWHEFTIEIPQDGRYALMAHGSGTQRHARLEVSLDGSAAQDADLMALERHPVWTLVAPGCRPFRPRAFGHALKAGRHVVRLRLSEGDFSMDGLVLTANPQSFEQR